MQQKKIDTQLKLQIHPKIGDKQFLQLAR